MVNKLRKINIILMIFLTLITMGIYVPVWFLIQKKAINDLKSKEKLTDTPFQIVLVLYSFSLFILIYQIFSSDYVQNSILDNIDNFISVTGAIIVLVMSFKVRRIFHQYFNIVLKKNIMLSKLWTFLFGIYYLQFKINKILDSNKFAD